MGHRRRSGWQRPGALAGSAQSDGVDMYTRSMPGTTTSPARPTRSGHSPSRPRPACAAAAWLRHGQRAPPPGATCVGAGVLLGSAVKFSVSVPYADTYFIWARAMGLDWTHNSFFVSVDGSTPYHFEIRPVDDQWMWGWQAVHAEGQMVWPFSLSRRARTRYASPAASQARAWTASCLSTARTMFQTEVPALRHHAHVKADRNANAQPQPLPQRLRGR